jgi:oxalate decarboxylase/phosphoglucose isomerase-like protein (cupin superfamily)
MTVIKRSSFLFADLPGRRSADPLDGVDSKSSARFVTLGYTEGRTAHHHPRSEEVMYVVKGRGHIWIDGTRHPVEAGDVVHVETGAAHATVPDPDSTMELMCFFPHPDLSANYEATDIVVAPPREPDSGSQR